MRSLGAAFVLFAILTALAVAGLAILRTQDLVAGPSSPLAEIVFALLPLVHLLLAVLVLRAEAAIAPVRAHPAELPFRISPAPGRSIELSAKVLGVWSTITITLVVAFLVSLYPRAWSEAWICEQTGPGETSCDIVDGTALQYILFAVGVTNLTLFVLGGSVTFLVMMRDAQRTFALPPALVELSVSRLLPGVPFEALIVQHGSQPLRLIRGLARCTESSDYSDGSSTSTATEIVHESVLVQRAQIELARGRPLRLRFPAQLPSGAMHTWIGTRNTITWTFVVEAISAAGRTVRHELPIVVAADREGSAAS
jgi:hypothetical protein